MILYVAAGGMTVVGIPWVFTLMLSELDVEVDLDCRFCKNVEVHWTFTILA